MREEGIDFEQSTNAFLIWVAIPRGCKNWPTRRPRATCSNAVRSGWPRRLSAPAVFCSSGVLRSPGTQRLPGLNRNTGQPKKITTSRTFAPPRADRRTHGPFQRKVDTRPQAGPPSATGRQCRRRRQVPHSRSPRPGARCFGQDRGGILERIDAPLTAGLLKPFRGDRLLAEEKRCALRRAVGLKAAA